MRRLKKVLSLLLALTLVLSLPVSSSAASGKKKVYVVKKIVTNYYDSEEGNSRTLRTFTYKNGLLKKSVTDESNEPYKTITKYQYGKKSRLKGYKYAVDVPGEKPYYFKETITLNKKGYITKVKNADRSSDYTTIKYNKKNKCTQCKNHESGGSSDITKFTYKGKKCTAKRSIPSEGLMNTTVYKYKNGRVISSKTYSPDGTLLSKSKYTYKKVTTTKKTLVNAQQDIIGLSIFNYF